MKNSILLLLLACLSIASCDDIIFTDGRTIADGYVTDSLTNQGVLGARVYLFACNSSIVYFGDRCKTILDSAITNYEGYYRFRFRDRRRTNFGVSLGTYLVNDFVPVRLANQPNRDAQTVDNAHYLVREGKKNQFNFLVTPFKTVQLHVHIAARGYQRASVSTRLQSIDFEVPLQRQDTVLHLKAIFNANFTVYGGLYAPDIPYLPAQTALYVGTADTTQAELIFQ